MKSDSLTDALLKLQDGTLVIGESLLKLINTLIDRHLELHIQVEELEKKVDVLMDIHKVTENDGL